MSNDIFKQLLYLLELTDFQVIARKPNLYMIYLVLFTFR